MKATFPLNALRDAVKAVCNVVPSRTTKDILKNIKLDVSGDAAFVYATDSENSMISHVRGVTSDIPFATLLPAAKLTSILAELSADTLTIDVGQQVTIRSGGSRFVIQVEDHANFLPVIEFDETAFLSVPGSALKRMLDRTLFCVALADKNPALTGICVVREGEKLTFVSTDRNRMSADSCPVTVEGNYQETAANFKPILPHRSMATLRKIITDGPVDILIQNDQVKFRTGECTYCCVRVNADGKRFPNFRMVLGFEIKHTIPVVATTLSAAIRQAMITTSEESIAINFSFKDNEMKLVGKASNVGNSEISVPVAFDGDVSLMLNPRYILDAIRVVDHPTFNFGIFFLPNDESPTGFDTSGNLRIESPDGWMYSQSGMELQ